MSLKIIFAGTPDFAVPTLKALLDSKHKVVAVYTQPDRPAGRGRKLTPSPVKALALQHNLTVMQPKTLRGDAEIEKLDSFEADLMVVIAYGLLLPKSVLDLYSHGCINVHASLLPRWRGAAPIQYAILHGDKETGITIMQMTEGLDAGDMLTKAETVISAQDNSQLLHDRLSNMGAELLLTTLDELERGDLSPQQQDEALVTYAPKINKSDALIDWRQSAVEIVRKVQAFYGWPVAYSHFNGEVMRIWQAVGSIESSEEAPGTLYLAGKNQLAVSCGEGCLYLEKIQLPGKKVMTAVDFINANRDFEKEQLS